MVDELKKKDLEKQGYRFVGSHSAIKVCHWTKRCIRGEDVCYKKTFYGINSHRCVQMTPCVSACSHRCVWCWRDIEHTSPSFSGEIDEPEEIIEGCISKHVEYLRGFGGNSKASKEIIKEAYNPKHFAISLSGEPTCYPKLPELVLGLRKRGISSFLVSNGTNPDMLRKLIEKDAEPTQVYVTLGAPDEATYKKVCKPLISNGWNRILDSLSFISKFSRGTIRLTLVKGLNMIDAKGYADLIEKSSPRFVELKGYVHVGYSQERLSVGNMPTHEEIFSFAEEISRNSSYRIVDEKKESRVVLLMKEDFDGRVMEF